MKDIISIICLVVGLVGSVVLVGWLDRPEDHDDSDAWETEYCRGMFEKGGAL